MFKLQNNRQITRSMNKKFIIIVILIFVTFSANTKENSKYYEKGIKNFENKLYDIAKSNFEKNIVRNPKHVQSYLYLSKIYKLKKKNDEFEKNLNTALLLEPKNEEALYLFISKKINDGDYEIAQKKLKIFNQSCKTLCDKKFQLNKLVKKSEN